MSTDHRFHSADIGGYLGFANLPNQVHRKSVKKGFEFTLMVIGESGLGKSTLINSLFYIQMYKNRKLPSVEEIAKSTIDIVSNTIDIEERGVKLKLTVVDTPGFGDGLNNSRIIEPIIKHIDEQFEKYLKHETSLNRKHLPDSRVHCCFYFISPIGYGIKPLDILAMKQLHTKVNLIPIIGKADALTPSEVSDLKKNILRDLEMNGVNIYSVPDCDPDEDEDYKEQIRGIKEAIPFAISSSCETFENKGKKVQGRLYPWGMVETENSNHSDFVKLKSLLVTHLQDLREVTAEVHYENYRAINLIKQISSPSKLDSAVSDNFSKVTTDYRLLEKEAELKRMQQELQLLQQKMKEKENVHNGN